MILNSENELKDVSSEIGCKYIVCNVTDSNLVQEVVNAIGEINERNNKFNR